MLPGKVLNTVVRIIGESSAEGGGGVRGTIGSGFLVAVPSETYPEQKWYPYVVTCDHVVRGQKNIEVVAVNSDGQPFAPHPIREWVQPLLNVDLAVAQWDHPDTTQHQLLPWNIIIPAGRITAPDLGQVVYYCGILAPLDIPMARSGTIGG